MKTELLIKKIESLKKHQSAMTWTEEKAMYNKAIDDVVDLIRNKNDKSEHRLFDLGPR